MPTANEVIADLTVGHQVDLQLYANGVVRRMIALLNRTDADLFAALSEALENAGTAWSIERLELLLASVRTINAAAYGTLAQALGRELADLAQYEAQFQLGMFRAAIPAEVVASVGVAEVSVPQVYSAALARPFQGRLLREWASSIEASRLQRIRDEIRIGFVEQQTVPQIVRRIRGTRARAYSDGIIEIDRRSAENVVRTAVAHTAAHVRESFFDRNSDLIKALEWSATLDLRTRDICRPRDGKRYEPKTHKPIGHTQAWLSGPGRSHWGCRSCALPITKSWSELGGANLPEFSPATRASMDGQVAAEQTYGAWLRRQSAARQDEVLGATRGALFRRGGLEIEAFTNNRGTLLSLQELRSRDAEAFRKAGL